MPNVYADTQQAVERWNNNQPFDTYDARTALRYLEDASRKVDDHCGPTRLRWFYTNLATYTTGEPQREPVNQYYTADVLWLATPMGRVWFPIPDCLAATQVALDVAGDGSFSQILTAADYALTSSDSPDPLTPPYDRLTLLLDLTTIGGPLLLRSALARITGSWGFCANTEPVQPAMGGTAPAGTLADATTTAFATSIATDIAVGQTLLLGAEQVYIAAAVDSTHWTVVRAMNGTTGAAHAAVAMSRYTYLPQVREATLIYAHRLWERKKTGFATTTGNMQTGSFKTFKGVDSDFEFELKDLRRVFA